MNNPTIVVPFTTLAEVGEKAKMVYLRSLQDMIRANAENPEVLAEIRRELIWGKWEIDAQLDRIYKEAI